MRILSQQYFPFDQVVYFPDPEGGRGSIFYGGIVNGSSEYDGKWFRASQEGEAALRAALASAHMCFGIHDLLLTAFASFGGA